MPRSAVFRREVHQAPRIRSLTDTLNSTSTFRPPSITSRAPTLFDYVSECYRITALPRICNRLS